MMLEGSITLWAKWLWRMCSHSKLLKWTFSRPLEHFGEVMGQFDWDFKKIAVMHRIVCPSGRILFKDIGCHVSHYTFHILLLDNKWHSWRKALLMVRSNCGKKCIETGWWMNETIHFLLTISYGIKKSCLFLLHINGRLSRWDLIDFLSWISCMDLWKLRFSRFTER